MRRFHYSVTGAEKSPSTAPLLLTGDLCDIIADAAELGYEGVEIHTREDAPIDFARIHDKLDETGVRFASIVTGRLNTQGGCCLSDERPYIVKAAIEGMQKYIRIAENLKTDLIIGWLRGSVPAGASPARFMARLADSLKTVSEDAAESGVKIHIEVINRYETNVFNTAVEMVGFIEEHGLANCYAHMDTFHMNIEEADPFAALRAAGSRLGYVHLADNTRRYPGTGAIDFPKILGVLDEIGYDGWVSVECLPQPDGRTAAKESIRYLKAITG